MFTLFEELNIEPTQAKYNAAMGIALVLGLANCFFGRRLFRITVALVGVALAAGASWLGSYQWLQNRTVATVGAGVGGVLTAVLLILYYRLALFVMGAACGLVLGWVFCRVTSTDPSLGLFVSCGVGGGLASLVLERLVVILLSSLGGAALVAAGALHFLGYGPTLNELMGQVESPPLEPPSSTPVYVALGCGILLAIVGMVVQFKLTYTKPAEEDADESEEDEDKEE